jgi:hypothetical protein
MTRLLVAVFGTLAIVSVGLLVALWRFNDCRTLTDHDVLYCAVVWSAR